MERCGDVVKSLCVGRWEVVGRWWRVCRELVCRMWGVGG